MSLWARARSTCHDASPVYLQRNDICTCSRCLWICAKACFARGLQSRCRTAAWPFRLDNTVKSTRDPGLLRFQRLELRLQRWQTSPGLPHHVCCHLHFEVAPSNPDGVRVRMVWGPQIAFASFLHPPPVLFFIWGGWRRTLAIADSGAALRERRSSFAAANSKGRTGPLLCPFFSRGMA